MFASIAWLLVLGVVLIPGYAYSLTRRSKETTARSSRPMETIQVIVSAFVFTAAALAVFGVVRLVPWIGEHSPDPRALIRDPSAYLLADDTRLLWLLGWITAITLAAVVFAWLAAQRRWLPEAVFAWADPPVIDQSAWHLVFNKEVPGGARVFISCDMQDGRRIGGQLAWYSTETEETEDREIVLAPPMYHVAADGKEGEVQPGIQRLVISARHIKTLYVIYVS